MTLLDTITADKQAVVDAQAALDAANAKLAADEAKLAGIQPHLDLLAQVEGELSRFELTIDPIISADIVAAMEDIRQRITPLIQQMRDLLTA